MTTKLDATNITDGDIRKLRDEATAASDYVQVDLCNRALTKGRGETEDQDGNPIGHADWTRDEARQACADAINHARAQAGLTCQCGTPGIVQCDKHGPVA